MSGMLIKREWLDPVPMKGVILHWTAGDYVPDSGEQTHYHFIFDGRCQIIRGVPIARNSAKGLQKGYAAHTRNCNTGWLGLSACAMGGAKERPFDPGKWPLKEDQLKIMCGATAELCDHYGIPVTPKTVLTHAEVQNNLGIRQNGKWDIAVFPWASKTFDTARECGDYIRSITKGYL